MLWEDAKEGTFTRTAPVMLVAFRFVFSAVKLPPDVSRGIECGGQNNRELLIGLSDRGVVERKGPSIFQVSCTSVVERIDCLLGCFVSQCSQDAACLGWDDIVACCQFECSRVNWHFLGHEPTSTGNQWRITSPSQANEGGRRRPSRHANAQHHELLKRFGAERCDGTKLETEDAKQQKVHCSVGRQVQERKACEF